MAYAGSGNADVVKRLLEKVAADPSSVLNDLLQLLLDLFLAGFL